MNLYKSSHMILNMYPSTSRCIYWSNRLSKRQHSPKYNHFGNHLYNNPSKCCHNFLYILNNSQNYFLYMLWSMKYCIRLNTTKSIRYHMTMSSHCHKMMNKMMSSHCHKTMSSHCHKTMNSHYMVKMMSYSYKQNYIHYYIGKYNYPHSLRPFPSQNLLCHMRTIGLNPKLFLLIWVMFLLLIS